MINLYLSRLLKPVIHSIPKMISSRGHYMAQDNFVSAIISLMTGVIDELFYFLVPNGDMGMAWGRENNLKMKSLISRGYSQAV